MERTIGGLAAAKAGALSADEALRFLLRVDGVLYSLEGQAAVAYGGGVHAKHRLTGYHEFFVQRVRPGERVLDVGCGVGWMAFEMAERAKARVVGIDQDAETIRVAESRFAHPQVRYLVGDVLRALPDERFDVVVLSNVLEHLPARPRFLRQIRQTLGPSRVLIRVPLFEREWRVPLRKELGVEWRLDATHETEYTLDAFAEELRVAGMALIQQEVRWGEIWAEARWAEHGDPSHHGADCTRGDPDVRAGSPAPS
jgi:SAM-dependent methyltransferase